MPIVELAWFDSEVGHIEGLIRSLIQFQCWGKTTIVVNNDGCFMDGEYQTYFPKAMNGLHDALGTIDLSCRNLRHQLHQRKFNIMFAIEQTLKILS